VIGSFTLVKNEARWLGAHLASWLPVLDQLVFFDGNSEDGTQNLIKQFQRFHPDGKKIILLEDKDPKDLQDDYVRIFNECLHTLETDVAIFTHPDMICADPGNLREFDGISATVQMESFAGNPGGKVYKINGRAERWKNIYRLRNPDLGLHYFGHYGAANEDCYFSAITGDKHDFYGPVFEAYPYSVEHTTCKVLHYSDVRTIERRLDRMVKCLINQGATPEEAFEQASTHPRVTLKNGGGFSFALSDYHPIFKTWEDSLCVKS